MLRKYTSVDMLRILKFADEPEGNGLKGMKLLFAYNKKHPELSAGQKFLNLCNALDIDPIRALKKNWSV